MYDYLTREDNPFPPVCEPHAPKVVCCYAYPGAAYANVGEMKEWHVDFLNSQGDVMVACQNVQNGVRNYTIHFPCGKAKAE